MTELSDTIIAEQESVFTLADMTESYMDEKQIFNEKYYVSYLKYAGNAWAELFNDTLFCFNARWLPVVKVGNTYTVRFPKDCSRGFISANVTDNCNLVKRIPYNSNVSVITKPNPASYNCSVIVSSFVTTTKLLFTSGGIDYYQKQYLRYCPNGDIIEVTITPLKKYLDYIGDIPGDYNDDYNNDYSMPQEAFGNFVIAYDKQQRLLCNLDTEENGCPKNTEDNTQKLIECCYCYSNLLQNCCNIAPVYTSVGMNDYGCVTLNESRNGLVYTPPVNFYKLCNGTIPDYIMVYFKANSSGNEVTGAAIIPDDFFIRNALTLGIDWYAMRLSNKYSWKEKLESRAMFDHAINEIIRSKFFMSLEVLTQVSEIQTIW